MGIITTAYTQQAFGNLFNTLSENEVNLDKSIQLVRDIFAMSTKSLGQVARAGAFHHLIRRKATLEDTGLNDIKELKHPLVSLPLTKSGVIGDNMEQTLKDRVDKNKQLKELLPELHVNKTFSVKRKATGNQFPNDWSKKPKFDNAQGSTFTCAKSGTQRIVQRTSTVTRPDKDDKSSALPFGPTSAPRVFTKVVSVEAAHLRAQDIRLEVYLDDWFLVNQSSLMLVQDREIVLNLLVKLGFIINLKKSSLTPTQKITYIGALFHLDLGIVMPTQERVLKLQKTVKEMKLKKHATAREFLHLLGIMASCIEMIPYARLHMRPIQIYLLSHWRPTSQNLELNVPITQYLISHLIWWSDTANITKGRSLQHWETHVTITTDASTSNGWGGHMDSQIVQGTWSEIQKTQHINCLELEAVLKTIQHFLPQLKGKNVLLRCDNSTVVQYINKQGGTKSIQLCQKTWDLLKLLIEHKSQIKAAHKAGKANVLADLLSRKKIRHTEWSLQETVAQQIFVRCRSNEMVRRYERKFSKNQELNKNNTMTHPTKYKQ
ncbi:Hypothetical predicted protein [Mytilus galloprovincialis]|uniref:Reverse transcriptase domain-containing protein n=1 Tax=Mytilus galloprovincialis TaxID=29158 RepID=A0A8B6BS04_MYTGA|nr:Hypothetical predicted protein [Mytilus galloprovincialis]